jgi:hypothetical protein
MTPPYQFVYLDIQGLWPTSDETLAREIARVTPAGYGLRGAPGLPPVPPDRPPPSLEELVDMLTPPGVLQICLRRTLLFVDCGETDIADMHVAPPVKHPCQNQALCVEALTEGLWLYERESISDERSPQDREQQTTETLRRLYDLLGDYTLLQRQRALPSTLPPLRRERIQTAYTTIIHMAQAVILDARRAPSRHHKARRCAHLCDYMRSVLRKFGPQEYSNTAMQYALAHILMTFGIDAGPEKKVVDRIRTRLKRLDHS